MGDYIPDYNDLYAAHERRQERALRKYPICDCCDERITDEYLYKICGVFVCEECLKEEYRKKTEDYMEEE
jgi:hypothetical protein